MQAEGLRTALRDLEVERAPLQLADCLVIQLACDVARQIANGEPHDLVVNAAIARADGRPDAFVDVGRGEAARADRRQIDQRTRRRQRMEGLASGLEVPLDEALARKLADAFLVQLAPRIGAGVVDRAA